MKINIVMLACGRAPLTLQAIRSLYQNTPLDSFNLTVVNDGEDFPGLPLANAENADVICLRNSGHILGRNRNLGAIWSEKRFGRGDYLCFLDNDVAVFEKWSEKIARVFADAYGLRAVGAVGGYQHPYHATNHDWGMFREADAVAGYSLFIKWSTWDICGPFDESAAGTGQSEDFSFCQRIKNSGWAVGYVHPPVLAHCGITNTEGKPATGAEHFPRRQGLIYQ